MLVSFPAEANAGLPKPGSRKEANANSLNFPRQILRTGVNLDTPDLSANSKQLAKTIGLTPLLNEIDSLEAAMSQSQAGSIERLGIRQDLLEAKQKAFLKIVKTCFEVDFTIAEIDAELQVYDEILSSYIDERERMTNRTNTAAFVSNGILWAVAEALTIPGFARPRFSIPSGITGIPAGLVPSIASLWTMKLSQGKSRTSEDQPNMLSRIFGYPVTDDVDFPDTVWDFFKQVPPGSKDERNRFEVLVDRWIADANIPDFNDRSNREQLDVLTASVPRKKGLSIDTLRARKVMLKQLSAEIMKMKRLLLELVMVVNGEKELKAGG